MRLLVALALIVLVAGCAQPASTSSSGTVASSPPAASASTPASSSSASTSATSSSSAAPRGPMTVQRTVEDNSFPNATFAIRTGDTVTWMDNGSNPHSVSANDGSFDSNPNCSSTTYVLPGNCLAKGGTFSHKFDAAGSFQYHCRIHSGMTGTITVAAS